MSNAFSKSAACCLLHPAKGPISCKDALSMPIILIRLSTALSCMNKLSPSQYSALPNGAANASPPAKSPAVTASNTLFTPGFHFIFPILFPHLKRSCLPVCRFPCSAFQNYIQIGGNPYFYHTSNCKYLSITREGQPVPKNRPSLFALHRPTLHSPIGAYIPQSMTQVWGIAVFIEDLWKGIRI